MTEQEGARQLPRWLSTPASPVAGPQGTVLSRSSVMHAAAAATFSSESSQVDRETWTSHKLQNEKESVSVRQ